MPVAANQSISFTVSAGSAIVYGASTDNRTQDPSVQLARRLTAHPEARWIIPVAGSTAGNFGSFPFTGTRG